MITNSSIFLNSLSSNFKSASSVFVISIHNIIGSSTIQILYFDCSLHFRLLHRIACHWHNRALRNRNPEKFIRLSIAFQFVAWANKKNHTAFSCFIRYTMDIWNCLNKKNTRKCSLFNFTIPCCWINKVTEHTNNSEQKNRWKFSSAEPTNDAWIN